MLGLIHDASTPALTIAGVGALGTFTTFSSFARDVVALVEFRRVALAAVYAVLSCTAGVGAAWVGMSLV